MKVLYVDQFGKTSGCYSLPQAEYIYTCEDIDITEYISDNIDFALDGYSVRIVKGFRGAYKGSAIKKAINYIKSLRELKHYIRINNVDIVHLQWFSLPWIEWAYVKQLHKLCKVVITIHDVIPFNNRPLEMNCLDWIYKNSDHLLFHTDYAREQFEKNYKTRKPSTIITQGFCAKKDYTIIEKRKAKTHFGIPENAIVFLYYGAIRESKGLDILIRAISIAHNRCERVYFLAGGAFQKVREEAYKNLVANKLDAGFSNVFFGFVPSEEEPWYFSAADVCCLPYREITQSGVAQTALMYELPLIATDIGDMRQVARPGFNGELMKVDDVDSLADIIVDFAENKDKLNNYTKGSKYLAENEFSLETKSHIVANVYRNLTMEG